MAKRFPIQEFSGVAPGGLYYLEGMVPAKVGQASVLTPRYSFAKVIDENDTGFSSLSNEVMQGYTPLNYIGGDIQNLIGIDSASVLYDFNSSGVAANQNGEIHSNSQTAGNNNGILSTVENNVLYTSKDWLGVGYRGTAESGSDGTTIVDEEGRNLSNLGVGTNSDNNKVYNLTKGEERTISSISTTNSTNDTMDLTSGNTTNEDGDAFIVFVDKKFDFFSSVTHPQFKGQEDKADFDRQMAQLGLTFYVGNGNYLGALDATDIEASGAWDENGKQLPRKTQFRCMAENNDSMLIGGEIRNKGKLMYWDGSSSGFNNIIDIQEVPLAIEPSQGGWIVLMGSGLYFTNGSTIERLAEAPDLTGINTAMGSNYNGMEISDDKVFILGAPETSNNNRDKDGMYIYDFDNGWSYNHFNYDSSGPYINNSVGAIKKVATASGADLFTSFDSSDGEANVSTFGSFSPDRTTAGFFVGAEDTIELNKLSLSLAPRHDGTQTSDDNTKVDINVAVSPAREFLWKKAQSTSNSTKSQIEVNTSSQSRYTADRGNKIMVLEGPAAGEVSWITNVDDSSADEKWDISPSLSSAPNDTDEIDVVTVTRGRPQSKSVDITDLSDEVEFVINGVGQSSRFYIEIVIESTSSTPFMPDIHKIDVYG